MKSIDRYRVASIVFLLSCGHTELARPPAASPRAQPSASAAPAAPQAIEEDQLPALEPPTNRQDVLDGLMFEHFEIVTFARDCVVSGELLAMRAPLRALADFEYREVIPELWMPFVTELQDAARVTSEADDLALAASGIARMGQVCGNCHRAVGLGPQFESAPEAERPKLLDSLHARMERHTWAADRMWLGLIVPSDEEWTRGAKALAEAPKSTPKGATAHKFSSQLRDVRKLGARALDAQSSGERADAYGALLSSCAECHETRR